MTLHHGVNGKKLGWLEKCVTKRQQALAKIPKEWIVGDSVTSKLKHPYEEHPNNLVAARVAESCGFLTTRELTITEDYNVQELLDNLASGKITAYESTVAFCKRAALAQQLVRSSTSVGLRN